MYVYMYVIRVAVAFATRELHVCEWEGFYRPSFIRGKKPRKNKKSTSTSLHPTNHTEKTFLPKWLEITSSSIFPAIWAGFSYWNSRKTGFPALRAGKSCSYGRKNWAGSNFKPFWQECFFIAMHPQSKISFTVKTHQGAYVSRGDCHSSDTRGHIPTLSIRYAQDQHVLSTLISFMQSQLIF